MHLCVLTSSFSTCTVTTVNVLNFEHFSRLLANKMLIIESGIRKMLVKIANREDPAQTSSSEAVWSGSALFVQGRP